MVIRFVRKLAASCLLTIEGILTVPFFAVSWLVSAVCVAVLLGYRFAKMDDEAAKLKILRAAMGEKGDE